MDGDDLIRNVGRSRLPSEDEIEDTNLVDEIVLNTINNIPSESPRSSLTAASNYWPQNWAALKLTIPDQK